MHLKRNTLFYGDNLDILREYIENESVDLIYLDPPFNLPTTTAINSSGGRCRWSRPGRSAATDLPKDLPGLTKYPGAERRG